MLRRLGSTDAGDAEGGWSHALPGAESILRVELFCSTWLVTHLCRGQGKPPGVPGAQSVLRNLLNTPFRRCFQMLSIPVAQEPGRQIAQ